MANKSKKAKINKSVSFKNIYKNVDVKATAKNLNNFAFETTEVVVEEVIEKSAQWQKVADKAIKAGLKLSANQQELTFKTLETMKGHMLDGTKRMKGMFSKN